MLHVKFAIRCADFRKKSKIQNLLHFANLCVFATIRKHKNVSAESTFRFTVFSQKQSNFRKRNQKIFANFRNIQILAKICEFSQKSVTSSDFRRNRQILAQHFHKNREFSKKSANFHENRYASDFHKDGKFLQKLPGFNRPFSQRSSICTTSSTIIKSKL